MVTIFALVLAGGVCGQSRNDMLIFIEPATGGSLEENAFFDENLRMEIGAASYTITDAKSEADYSIIPKVVINPSTGDRPPRSLVLRLVRNSDSVELVQLGNDYTEVSEAYEWNLYLIYQAMANVPLTKNNYDPPPPIITGVTSGSI
jgi:hypothetical protein